MLFFYSTLLKLKTYQVDSGLLAQNLIQSSDQVWEKFSWLGLVVVRNKTENFGQFVTLSSKRAPAKSNK